MKANCDTLLRNDDSRTKKGSGGSKNFMCQKIDENQSWRFLTNDFFLIYSYLESLYRLILNLVFLLIAVHVMLRQSLGKIQEVFAIQQNKKLVVWSNLGHAWLFMNSRSWKNAYWTILKMECLLMKISNCWYCWEMNSWSHRLISKLHLSAKLILSVL